MLLKMIFAWFWYDLDTWPTNIIQGHCIFFDQRYHVHEVWARLQRKRRYVQDKGFLYIILLWPSYLTLKISSRSLHTLYSKALFMWSMSQIGLSGKYIITYALKKEFSRGLIWPWTLTFKLYSGPLHTLWL